MDESPVRRWLGAVPSALGVKLHQVRGWGLGTLAPRGESSIFALRREDRQYACRRTSSQRHGLVAMPVAMPTSLVTSSVTAPSMSPNTHCIVQNTTAGTSTLGR